MEKLAILIHNGILTNGRIKNRAEFFAFFRTAINNHIRGQVQRYRFTIKRTGIKPPPKDQRHLISDVPTKPIEISLDDVDAHLQVGELVSEGDQASEMLHDLEVILTPLEYLVCRQMYEPNTASYLIAELNAHRGRLPGKVPIDIHISAECLAEGIGVPYSTYLEVVSQVQEKVKHYLAMQDTETEETEFNLALAALERVFGVQVPRQFDKMVIRRLFTIAARDQYAKVGGSPEVQQQLRSIGAKIPEVRGPTFTCFGVLYQKGNRICEACQLKEACHVEAANFGLGEITLSPRLLGARQMRVASLVGVSASAAVSRPVMEAINDDGGVPVEGGSVRDDEVLHYLSENFKATKFERPGRSEVAYKHRDKPPSGERIIFCVAKKGDGQLHLRFSSPSTELEAKLEKRRNGHYLVPSMPANTAIELVEQHAKDTFR
jgi:hypothetical protein